MKIITNLALVITLTSSSLALADMAELSDADLQQTTGQEGVSISLKLDFAEGTRISTRNEGLNRSALIRPADSDNWQVLENITGFIEAKDLRTDLVQNYGSADGTGGKNATQTTLPAEVTFGELRIEGLYVGPGAEVTRDANGRVNSHNFLMGLEIDGSLRFPNETKITTFVVQ